MKWFSTLIASSIIFVLPGVVSGAERDAFFETHCIDCHGPGAEEGGLRLDRLPDDLANPSTFSKWVLIYDRVLSGEMPPEEMPQPTASERAAFTGRLHDDLLAAERQRELARGEGLVRRLNRFEYEKTLRDLLDLPGLDVQAMLPSDGEVHHFDKVARGLDISHVQMRKYMAASDSALHKAVVESPERPQTKKLRMEPADQNWFRWHMSHGSGLPLKGKELSPGLEYRLPETTANPWVRSAALPPRDKIESTVLLVRNDNYPAGFHQFSPERAGWCRVRFSIWSLLWDHVRALPAEETQVVELLLDKESVGFFEAPSMEPAVHEITLWMEPGQTLNFINRSSRTHGTKNHPDAVRNHRGPGIAFDWCEVEGPLIDQWPPRGHRRLFGNASVSASSGLPGTGADGELTKPKNTEKAEPAPEPRELLRNFAKLAFRRPVKEAEADRYLAIFEQWKAQGLSFREALLRGHKAILCSPDFLFLGLDDDRNRLLASRLSYMLWSSMPDEELLSADLSNPDVLHAQVERMLAGPKSQRFVEHFLDKWLELEEIDFTTPDEDLYPGYDRWLHASVLEESRAFFERLIAKDLPVRNFVESEFVMLNERLAEHYGIPNVEGTEFRPVPVPKDVPRGGFLTQAGVLKVTANGTVTSPVIRGTWVLERLVGSPPDPPPDNVPAIDPDTRGGTTIREKLAKHRADLSCAACHAKIDPPGFALESFDPTGAYRERYRVSGKVRKEDPFVTAVSLKGRKKKIKLGPRVDASGKLAGRGEFAGIEEFRTLVAEDEEQLARNFVEQLTVYATGAELRFGDRRAIEQILAKARKENYGVRSILHAVVQSDLFLR